MKKISVLWGGKGAKESTIEDVVINCLVGSNIIIIIIVRIVNSLNGALQKSQRIMIVMFGIWCESYYYCMRALL